MSTERHPYESTTTPPLSSDEPYIPPPGTDAAGDASRPARDPQPEPVDRAARLLVQRMQRDGYHPVILCGTSAAGKTTTLASLCSFLMRSGVATFDFGPWPIEAGFGSEHERLHQAKVFFEQRVQEFEDGAAPERTGVGLPYVVPLEIMPVSNEAVLTGDRAGSIRPVRLAVMDMAGELFKPQPKTGEIRRALPGDVERLLFMFEGALSMLYFGPVTRKAGYDASSQNGLEPGESDDPEERIKESPDLALMNALRGYEQKRPGRRQDRHLMLLSKWDLARQLDSVDFRAPELADVEAEIKQRFPRFWSQYKAMRVNPRAKWFTQYCAGVISDRTVTHLAKGSAGREAVDRYAMVVWNWLYQGATRSDQHPQGLTLFPEVVPKAPPKTHPLLAWLSGHVRQQA